MQIFVLISLVIIVAIFSGIETAYMSLTSARVTALVKQKKRGALALHRLKQNPHRFLITILIGNSLAMISSATIATVVFTKYTGSHGVGLATGIMTVAILIIGEITPKTYATQNSQWIALTFARPIELLSYLLTPVVYLLELISRSVARLFSTNQDNGMSNEEIKSLVSVGYQEGVLTREAAKMMNNILEIKTLTVRQVMTPKVSMKIVDGNKTLRQTLDIIVKSPYSRFPVWGDAPDNIIGILDVDDVLRCLRNKKLDTKASTIMRPVTFVPDSKKVERLLTEFEGAKVPLAIVVNEYSETVGLVTVEDILEEIVGEIFDKSGLHSLYIKTINKNLIRIDSRATMEEINKVLHLGFEDEHFRTFAGFIEHKFQKIPRKGEKLRLKNIVLEIAEANQRGIKSVLVRKI